MSAFLSFSVQPLIAKSLLPAVGGAASVWAACLVFFQAALLAGYGLAHILGRFAPKVQVGVYAVVLGLAAIALPFSAGGDVPQGGETLWVLGRLIATVGAPFAALSACAPLLQRWYAVRSQNPYFLYAASNAGSLLGLLAYPLVAEPLVGLHTQGIGWAIGYGIASLLVLACGVWRVRGSAAAPEGETVDPATAEVAEPEGADAVDSEAEGADEEEAQASRPAFVGPWWDRLRWMLLAAGPSALLVAVTNHVTTDLAPVPLLWVIPLALFLLTVIIAFGRNKPLPGWIMRALGLGAVFVLAAALAEANRPAWLLLGGHLGVFFLASLALHRALYERRPRVQDLTGFYLWMALGGVLGGAAVALAAPALLPGPWEYPVLIGLVFLAFPDKGRPGMLKLPVWAVPIAAAVAMLVSAQVGARFEGTMANVITFLPPAAVAIDQVTRPRRFALALIAIAVVGLGNLPSPYGEVVTARRGFHSTVRVVDEPGDRFRALVDGTTLHGRVARGEVCAPLTYFHPTGPAGEALRRRRPRGPVAVIGLGVGSLACYAADQPWTFFELNPDVVELAKDEELFGPVARAVGETRIVVGDARVQLTHEPDGSFDILVVDAFSSDAIPTHLLTEEAFALYRRKTRPNGLVLLNLSSRFLNLPPVVAASAGGTAWGRVDPISDDSGKSASSWVVVWRDSAPPAPWAGWTPVAPAPEPWTDDKSSILPHIIR